MNDAKRNHAVNGMILPFMADFITGLTHRANHSPLGRGRGGARAARMASMVNPPPAPSQEGNDFREA